MMCVNGIRKGNDKHWEAIQLWAASPRNEREILILLKKPYNACKQETKEGEDSQAHLKYFCQWASCSVKSMVCIEYMVKFFNPPLQSRIVTCHLQFFGYRKFVFSPIASFFILFAEPSASPQKITSEKMNEAAYKISWNPLPRDKTNGRVIAYEVNQTTLSITCTARSASTPSVLQNTTDTFIVLTGLLSCSVYKVEVRAYTSAGPGVFGRLTRNIATSGISM